MYNIFNRMEELTCIKIRDSLTLKEMLPGVAIWNSKASVATRKPV